MEASFEFDFIDATELQAIILHGTTTIKSALSILNDQPVKILLVVDPLRHSLLGTITDGDLRRAFIYGMNPKDAIETAYNRDPTVARQPYSHHDITRLLIGKNLSYIPLLNANNQIIGIFSRKSVPPSEVGPLLVIMAGGKGTRLRPLTYKIPKPMVKVGGIPILEHIINRALRQGIRRFAISVNYLGDQIIDYFSDGSDFNASITYLKETMPLGTAGSLSLLDDLSHDNIFVANGDVLSNVNYRSLLAYHKHHDSHATMVVKQYELKNPYGVVKTDGAQIVSFLEKPVYKSFINSGIYCLNPSVLRFIPKCTYYDMPTLFENIKQNHGRIIAYPITEDWLDIGTPQDYDKANI